MIDVVGPCQRLLDHIVACETDQWTLPAARYVAAGDGPAWDGREHLLVGLTQIAPGSSDGTEAPIGPGRGVGMMTMPRASLMVRLLRKVSTLDNQGKTPASSVLHADGLRVLADAGPLLDAIVTWLEVEQLTKEATWGQLDAIGPEGGYAGHLAVVTISPVQ